MAAGGQVKNHYFCEELGNCAKTYDYADNGL